MQNLYCSLATLSIALIFYSWRDYHQALMQRQQQLRERVAYMLWCMANAAVE